ncbi:MAG: extracellular solute-binding protein [Lachnospiraceae bacterium]|jgi:maltose-binding protein MalE|nr:extracellular solute-binding protein [Lachnospiraceae bacterium]
MAAKYKRVLAVLILLLLVAQMLYIGQKNQPEEEEEIVIEHPLLIWYTDPDIQAYMEASAAEASARYQVEIRAELVSEVDYIENINQASVAEEMEGPDVYVASSALLEKATLAGLTSPVTDAGLLSSYSEKAVQAVTYDGTVVARPFYIETCFMLYNCYYVNPENVPDSIDGILTYAEEFEADEVTEKVENIFKWNVADVIDNYMFLGAYTNLGGTSGDDKSQVSLDLSKIEECMAYYQSLNSFFAIDADTVTSEEVIQEFIDGKTVFTIVNVPMLAELDRAVKAGELPEYVTERTVVNEAGEEETVTAVYEPFYRIQPLPSLTDELWTRGLSVTNSVVVNPYSKNVDAAFACARYLTKERAGKLYEESGKLAACQSPVKAEEEPKSIFSYQSLYDRLLGDDRASESAEGAEKYQAVYEAYEQAAEVPKIMELSNVWLQLEVVLADIWRGADAGEELARFSELLDGQLEEK